MRQLGLFLGSAIVCTGVCLMLLQTLNLVVNAVKPNESTPTVQPANEPSIEASTTTSTSTQNEIRETVAPISRSNERVTLKPFGVRVSPKNSPVSPERFSGFHTGTDFETFPDEQETDIIVQAICEGNILRLGTATGYGGYLVQSCVLNKQDVTIVYGHIRYQSVKKKTGELLHVGDSFAVLGKGYSSETDGERKHLHLSIFKGTSVNIKGYVSRESDLKGWLDYQKIVQK